MSHLWLPVFSLLSIMQLCLGSAVVQLSDANYTTFLGDLDPDRYILMEYYANWCPHCRHFAPTYEQVGAFFEAENARAPVTVARADCASTVRSV